MDCRTSVKYCLIAGSALMVASCSGEKEAGRLEYALSQAGPNRVELEKVLDRYSRAPEDSLKYEAAVFLIENMPYYSYYEGEQLDNYLQYYPLLRATLREKKSPDVAVDSIQKMYGPYSVRSLTRKRDIETVDSTYLCNNIDWAFKVWREQPWGRNVTFEEFKEYILPYRIGDEKLAYWRETYYNYYNHLFVDEFFKMTGVDITDPVQAAIFISNNVLWLDQLHFTTAAPADLPHVGPDIAWNKCGSCRELSDFVVYACRALGIPCAIDRMPVLRNERVGHTWVTFKDNDGVLYYQEFLRGIQKVEGSHMHTDPKQKVYRTTFSLNAGTYAETMEYEEWLVDDFKDPHYIDVTRVYANDYVDELPIPSSAIYRGISPEVAYLCASTGLSWTPVAWSPFSRRNLVFRNLDRGELMRVATIKDGRMYFLTHPFYIDKDHQARFFTPDGTLEEITVYSRTPLVLEQEYSTRMIGGVFEGSNDPGFRDRDTLFMITELPERLIESVNIPLSDPYRYIRYYGPEDGYCNVSEVIFKESPDTAPLTGRVIGTPGCLEGDGSHEYTNVYDGKTWTSFNYKEPSGGWSGLDLGERKRIGYIAYTHRNMDNYVRPGDTYELFYCDKVWKSAGVLTAESDSLVYSGVPAGSIYLLKNLSRGRQAEAFSYEEGRQRWSHKKP